MRYLLPLAFLFVVLMSAGCTRDAIQERPSLNIDPSKATEIRLFADGRLDLNGKTSSLDQVMSHLQKQKGVPGAHVLYYRENSGGEPPAAWQPIMEAVVSAQLPIRLSDF